MRSQTEDVVVAAAHPVAHRVWRGLGFLNNLLLIPLFTILVLETGLTPADGRYAAYAAANLVFCALFFVEWALGLAIATDRKAYLKDPVYGLDLLSSIPFGFVFRSLRVVRLIRVARIVRVILQARRFRGRGARIVRMGGIVGATVFAGAVALRIVEPETCPRFVDALWWAIVTLTTVGYGDVLPHTGAGRAVASVMMVFGIGVFGYVAGFMSTLLEDPEEEDMLRILRRIDERLARIEAARDR